MQEVHQHLWESDCRIADVYDRLISEKKIHGYVEPRVNSHCDHDEEGSHNGDDIDKWEHHKQEFLELLHL